uniref:C6 domain-containing protein n=1 Tax=Syphacia muris TaxID=451379 RepID=A0A0N5ACG9_9BILA
MQPYVSLTSILLSITLPAVNGQQSGCDGQWSDWSDWSGCSFIFLPLVGYKMRIRTCTPSSAECVSPFYACQGNNFEVNECESDDTPIVTNNVTMNICTRQNCNPQLQLPNPDVSRLDASSTIVDNVVDGCLQQLLTCYLNNSSQTVHIQSPSGTMFAEGNGTATANFTCTNSGQWTASVGISVTDVTCSTLKSNCALCDPLQVGLVVADKLQSGRVQMQSTPLSNGCVLINISCTNDLETGGSSIISSNLQVLSNGNKTAEVSLRCNSDRQWQTDDGLTAPYIFCAIPKLAIGKRLLVS